MIIVVVGPLCSGKNKVGEILSKKGFEVISTADMIRNDMREKDMELTRKNLQDYVRDMRRKVGEFYPANKIKEYIKPGKKYVVQDLRNIHELREVKKLGNCFVISVDASKDIRFERMRSRGREKDPVTFENFNEIDEMELYGIGEKGFGFNINGCMNMADFKIENDGSLEDLKVKINSFIGKLSS